MRRVTLIALVVLASTACGAPARVGPQIQPRDPLDGYRVVYRIVDPERDANSVATEIVEVRRPYDGRVETRPDGKMTTTGRVTSREHFWQLGKDEELQFGVLRPPGGPTRDASIEALRDAARAGRAVAGGTDVVLRRTCWWFGYRDPAPKPLLPPTDASRVESCVDSSGVVLREVWTLAGEPARVVEAVELDPSAPAKKRFLEGKDPASTKVTTPKGAELVETQTLVRDVISGEVQTPFSFDKPKGWKRDRVALVGSTAGQGARPTQFLSQTFLRGDELVVMETGSGPQFAPTWSPSEGKRVAIGAGEGRLVYGVDRVEVRVLSAIAYARVIAPSEALAMRFVRALGD
jgi:hypothetical protein